MVLNVVPYDYVALTLAEKNQVGYEEVLNPYIMEEKQPMLVLIIPNTFDINENTNLLDEIIVDVNVANKSVLIEIFNMVSSIVGIVETNRSKHFEVITHMLVANVFEENYDLIPENEVLN